MMFQARYLLVLMSLCAIYTGFLYNECFVLPLFPSYSSWSRSSTPSEFLNFSGVAYPFGVDPAWATARLEGSSFGALLTREQERVGSDQLVEDEDGDCLGVFSHDAGNRDARFQRVAFQV